MDILEVPYGVYEEYTTSITNNNNNDNNDNNLYLYTGIGTNEVIIVQLLFRNLDEARKAYSSRNTTNRLSEKLLDIARTVGPPRKLKV